MRVLIDLTSLDDNFSGIEHYALYITKELIKNKDVHYHLVFKNQIKYFSSLELEQENISTKILSGDRKTILLFSLSKYINKYKPDYALFLAFQPSPFFKPNNRTKVISMIHDMVPFDVPETMKMVHKIFFKRCIKHALKISTEIITNSNFSKSRILFYNKKMNPNKIHVAYSSSSMPIVSKSFDYLKKQYGLPDEYLLALSTVEPRKNFANLIKWLDELWSENKLKYDLVIVGRKGWKTDGILKDIRNKGKIHFTGFVDENDISSIYSYSLCFLFPSIYEGFGTPLVESIVSNKLPVCSSIDVFKEIIGEDYPFFFDCRDKVQFFEALFKFLGADEQKKAEILQRISKKTEQFKWIESAKVINGLFK